MIFELFYTYGAYGFFFLRQGREEKYCPILNETQCFGMTNLLAKLTCGAAPRESKTMRNDFLLFWTN